MDELSIDVNQSKLHVIESTCILNKKLKRNNAIDGVNIIQVAGAFIVFHNIFQNTRKFINRISDSQIVGIAFLKSNENIVALATKSKSIKTEEEKTQNQIQISERTHIQLYTLGQKGALFAQLDEAVEFVDMQIIDKRKIILLGKQQDRYYFYFMERGDNINKKQANMNHPKMFLSHDRRILVIGQKGFKQLDLEMQKLTYQLKFPALSIDHYALIDNQFQVILSKDQLYCYHDNELKDFISLSDFQENLPSSFQPCSFVNVGRNLLISHKNSITLSHFVIENGFLKFLNHYTYKQKMKGGIINMEVSLDQMHLSLAVQLIERQSIKIQNFMFNLSILSSQRKFLNPFIRLSPLGTENCQILSLQGVISSDTYYLAGNTIISYSFNDCVQKKFKYSLHQVPRLLCVHPLGYQFVCLFDTQIKFYIKIQSQIIQVWTEKFTCSTANYMASGHLLLACLQDTFYQIVMYDTNLFIKIKNLPSVLMKHPVSRMELIENDSQVVLYVGRDLGVYVLKTGEKIAEFKDKKDKEEILALAYEPNMMSLLTSNTNKTLTFSKKLDDNTLEFKYQKIIEINEEITCIQINPVLQTVFMGTKSGKLLWTQYPLNLLQKPDLKYTIEYQQIKLSNNSVNQIYITNNLKYLFISFKNQGMVIARFSKIIKYRGNQRYSEFQVSNLNVLETSSKNFVQLGQQKLKSLLEKRKNVFNDLDQYKKEWQIQKNKKLKAIDTSNKNKQLNHINEALRQVQRIKKEKEQCFEQLKKIQKETSTFIRQQEQKYKKQIMLFYDKNIDLKVKKEKVLKRCKEEFDSIQKKCKDNIDDIQNQLKNKYNIFMENYEQMKKNLSFFDKRFQIEQQQAQQILLQLFAQKREKLQIEENLQNTRSNELRALITKNKKELQRYCSRKYFLEQKTTFFVEEVKFCLKEKQDLISIKKQLQMQLGQLQVFTNKKEKRLRKYFQENQILTKYQTIHNNLMDNLRQEVGFMEEQKVNLSKNIVAVQKELSEVAQLNEFYDIRFSDLKKIDVKINDKKYKNTEKTRYLQQLFEEMSQSLQKLKGNVNDKNKTQLFSAIYHQFFIGHNLQKIIQAYSTTNTSKQEQQNEYKIFNPAQNKKNIIENLQQHKKYLQKNMMLFQKHNKKIDEQMNLNFLKYQTQNYNLIAECNVRKQQTNKKKRILHDLIDSVKETQLCMNELQKDNFDEIKALKSNLNNHKSTDSIPFIEYKKQKEQQAKSRVKVLRKEPSEPTLSKIRQSTYQVRKMLDIQKISRPASGKQIERRIKTAMIKNRQSDNTIDADFSEFTPINSNINSNLKKPLTASGKRHESPFGQYYTYNGVKTKSTSKPTTCTTHTNNKYSIYQ